MAWWYGSVVQATEAQEMKQMVCLVLVGLNEFVGLAFVAFWFGYFADKQELSAEVHQIHNFPVSTQNDDTLVELWDEINWHNKAKVQIEIICSDKHYQGAEIFAKKLRKSPLL